MVIQKAAAFQYYVAVKVRVKKKKRKKKSLTLFLVLFRKKKVGGQLRGLVVQHFEEIH